MPFDGMIYQQKVGIPIDINCAPLLADLFLRHSEFHLVGLENSLTAFTSTVWPSDHEEDDKSCAWSFYNLVQAVLEAFYSD